MFGFLSFLVALLIKEPEKIQKRGMEKNQKGDIITTLFRRGVFIAAFTLMVSGYGFIPTLTFIPVFAKKIKVESFDLFFIACTLSALFIRVLGGWIPDRFGKKRAAIPSLLLFAVSIVGISFASNTSHFIETGILFGLSHGFVYPAIYALVIDLSPIFERGRAFAICSFAFNLGGTLGSFIYGVIAEHLGFQIMFQSAGLVCFFGFLLFTIFGKDSRGVVV
jgi:MFS family permease